MAQGEEIQAETNGHTELERWRWESKETKADRICREEHCTGEDYIENVLEFAEGKLWGNKQNKTCPLRDRFYI